jgi:hypothetical protein
MCIRGGGIVDDCVDIFAAPLPSCGGQAEQASRVLLASLAPKHVFFMLWGNNQPKLQISNCQATLNAIQRGVTIANLQFCCKQQ